MKVYYVQHKHTRNILNAQGTWSRNIKSYRLAEFETEEAATAAFPPGETCVVISREKREDKDK